MLIQGESETYSFTTDRIEFGLKAGKPYVKGIITINDIDSFHELVPEETIDEVLTQLKSGVIKLDIDHEKFRDPATGQLYQEPKNVLPAGKIIDAIKVKSQGKVWIEVLAELNTAKPKFKSIWESIKNGFLDGFSIAYDILDYARQNINGQIVTVLKSIRLRNVALTGDAVNKGCKIMQAFMKSASGMNLELEPTELDEGSDSSKNQHGGTNMTEETTPPAQTPAAQDPAPAAPAQAPAAAPAPAAPAAPVAPAAEPGLKSVSFEDYNKLLQEHIALKSKVQEQDKVIQDMKSFLDKPQLKSLLEPRDPAASQRQNQQAMTPLMMIN